MWFFCAGFYLSTSKIISVMHNVFTLKKSSRFVSFSKISSGFNRVSGDNQDSQRELIISQLGFQTIPDCMKKSASWFSSDHYEISFISVQIDFAAFLKDDERQADLTLKLRPLGVAVIRGQQGPDCRRTSTVSSQEDGVMGTFTPSCCDQKCKAMNQASSQIFRKHAQDTMNMPLRVSQNRYSLVIQSRREG